VKYWQRLIALCAALIALSPSIAQAKDHPAVWAVQGKYNTLYLTGTVHVLPAETALPDNVAQAYRTSEQLVMELDLNDENSLAGQLGMVQDGMLPAGETLSSQLDANTRRKLDTATKRLGLDASVIASFKPWLAALTLEQLQLAQLGMDANNGIDMQLAARAAQDHKRIRGLETFDEQLQFFTRMDAKQQQAYLDYTLTELETLPTEMSALLDAWRNGDESHLEKLLTEGLDQDAQLFTTLTSKRNQRWMSQLKPLLDNEHDDVLMAVGALHLVGDQGIVALLKKAGYRVTRQ